MRCIVTGKEAQIAALRHSATGVEWVEAASPAGVDAGAAAYFYLYDDAAVQSFPHPHIPVFVNSALHPLSAYPAQVTGINGWPWFLQQENWELTTTATPAMEAILTHLNKKWLLSPNQPGLITARVLSMIINEAYFALEDGVSTQADIDTAMKTGTNYPYGPFEWAELLGITNIYTLLIQLSKTDERCLPASLLTAAATAQ